MEEYLFKISLKPTDVWSKYNGQTVKPLYFVTKNKDAAKLWAKDNLKEGLSVRSISKMARKLATNVFTGKVK